MATHITKVAEKNGVKTIIKKVEECTLEDLAKANGIVVGAQLIIAISHGKLKNF